MSAAGRHRANGTIMLAASLSVRTPEAYMARKMIDPIVRQMLAVSIRGIERKKAQLGRLRPLSGGALARLQKYCEIELTYSSNAIGGNALTHRNAGVPG